MIKFTFYFIIALLPLLSNAEMGHCYYLEVEIETSNKEIYHGYFNFTEDFYLSFEEPYSFSVYANFSHPQELAVSEKLGNNRLLLAESENLTEYFLSFKSDFTIYPDILFVNYYSTNFGEIQIPQVLGMKKAFSKEDISRFKILQVIKCNVGIGVLTELDINDKPWLENSNYISTIVIGSFESTTELLIYNTLSEEITKQIEALKSKIHLLEYPEFKRITDEFKQSRIIAIGYF
ncbi:MAG: hypothetical protein RIC35_06520 [Marinoscillum sp.]